MKGCRKIMLILFILPGALTLLAQNPSASRDLYTLLTTPFNKRQLTLFRGQFSFEAGYKFAVRSISYDTEGNKAVLTNNGTGSVFHYYFVNARYGITDFLEAGIEANYLRHGMRTQTENYISTTAAGTSQVTLNKLSEVKGPGDLLLFASVRPPFAYKWFDFALTGGIYLPVSGFKPEMPSNNITAVSLSSFTINSYYKYSNGYGVPVYLINGSLKISSGKFTFAADLTFRTPRKEGSSIRWSGTLENTRISYSDKSYKYLLSNQFNLNASLHYQPSGWLDVYLNGTTLKTKGGWTEYWGKKYANRETMLVTLEPGFEIQVSPALRIVQIAGFPLAGNNSDGSFYIFTSFRFSNFFSGR